jgi:transposase
MFNQYEKNYRLAVARLIKRIGVDRLMSTDESKKETGKKSLYHNRLPASRPNCIGVVPAAYKGINVWAGITSFGHTEPVIYRQNLTSDAYKIIIREILAPFVEQHRPLNILQDNASCHNDPISLIETRNQRIEIVYYLLLLLLLLYIIVKNLQKIRLPAYSPDMNTIELVWHELKAYLRKKQCLNLDQFIHRIQKFFHYKLTPAKCSNYYYFDEQNYLTD